MVFKALRVPTLTEEVVDKLEMALSDIPGITYFAAGIEAQEFNIVFDDEQLDLQTLAHIMAQVGCPLRNINWVISEL